MLLVLRCVLRVWGGIARDRRDLVLENIALRHQLEGMGVSIRYAVVFQASPTGKLAALNGVLGVGEFESKADGSWTDTGWEWK